MVSISAVAGPAEQLISTAPVILDVPGRSVDLELKVSAPRTGTELPIILLSHGHGASVFLSSLHGYGPLADFWAGHGFVVIQPTHCDSGTLGLREADDPDAPLYGLSRAHDLRVILDRLDEVEAGVPGLTGRPDRSKIAVVGHSLGGHTACMLLGMRVQDPSTGAVVDARDDRVKVGVVLAAPGNGDDLADWAAENYPFLRHTDFSTMTTPALVVAGDHDLNPNFSARLGYRSDAYTSSPGPKTLLTVAGAEHSLGGVSGYEASETTDEDPARVATLRTLVWAYLRTALDPGASSWDDALAALRDDAVHFGTVQIKQVDADRSEVDRSAVEGSETTEPGAG